MGYEGGMQPGHGGRLHSHLISLITECPLGGRAVMLPGGPDRAPKKRTGKEGIEQTANAPESPLDEKKQLSHPPPTPMSLLLTLLTSFRSLSKSEQSEKLKVDSRGVGHRWLAHTGYP